MTVRLMMMNAALWALHLDRICSFILYQYAVLMGVPWSL